MDQGEKDHNQIARRTFFRALIAVTIAFVIMGVILNYGISQNSKAIAQLRITKANVSQLQRSNCTLKLALFKARLETYNKALRQHESEKSALSRTKNLTTIIVGMDGEEYCPTPKKYLIGKER